MKCSQVLGDGGPGLGRPGGRLDVCYHSRLTFALINAKLTGGDSLDVVASLNLNHSTTTYFGRMPPSRGSALVRANTQGRIQILRPLAIARLRISAPARRINTENRTRSMFRNIVSLA